MHTLILINLSISCATEFLQQNKTPPIIPKIRDPKDLSQYRKMPEEDASSSGDPTDSESYLEDSNPANPFVNFNMVRNESLQRQY